MYHEKIALITGANKGLGLETARQLARDHDFTVIIGARDKVRGTQAADGLDAHSLSLDPTNAASITTVFDNIRSQSLL